jgi:pimeloyl-ACP methyl ester carboxylesterase
MTYLAYIGSWISDNESLLSGIAAMMVVGGVVLSVFGTGFRRIKTGRGIGDTDGVSVDSGIELAVESPEDHEDEPWVNGREGNSSAPLTFRMLTAPSPFETKFADSSGVRIAYNERGTGPTNIVCAPGIISHLHLMGNFPSTRGTFSSLQQFARLIVFDKRGQGLSDPTMSAPDLDERTNDIEAVMDDAGLDSAILMGVSEGGPMCLNFAYLHPERVQGLVLVGTTARWLQSEDFPIGLPRRDLEGLPRNWGRGVVLRDIFFPSMTRQQVDDETYKAFEKLIASRTAVQQLIEMMIETDVRPILPEIRVPALVVHFTGDLAVPIRLGRFLADNLPNAEFLEVNGADHVDLSQSPEAIERIREFCECIAREAPAGSADHGTSRPV